MAAGRCGRGHRRGRRRRVPRGRHGVHPLDPGITIPAFNYDEWANTGANEVNMVKSLTLYDQIITKQPNPIDFWRGS